MKSGQRVLSDVTKLLNTLSKDGETDKKNEIFLDQTNELAENVAYLSIDFLARNKVPNIALDVAADCLNNKIENLTLGATDLTANARKRYTHCDDSDATRSAMDLLTKLIPSRFMESSEQRVQFLYVVTMAYTKMLEVVEKELNASYVIFSKEVTFSRSC